MQGRHNVYGGSRILLWSVFIAGITAASPNPVPGFGGGTWPRLTDLLNLACACIIFLEVVRMADLHHSFRVSAVVWAMTLPWIFMEIRELGGSPDPPVQRLLIRWVLCGLSAYVIASMIDKPWYRWRFMCGLLGGIMLSLSLVVWDSLSFSPTDVPVEELVNLAIYNGKDIYDFIYRASGPFGHPNGAAGCLLLGVAVVIGGIEEGRWPGWSILLAIALMGVTFYLTKSRGPLIMSFALVAYWAWIRTRGIRLSLILGGIAALLTAIMVVDIGGRLDDVLFERFFDIKSISVNASDRWWTIATSIELVLSHPLGMGSAYVAPLEVATGTSATHNAYLELALMGGLPLALFVVFRLAKVAVLLFSSRRPVEAWIAAYLIGIFAFESYFQQITIQLTTLWIVVSPAAILFSRQRTDAVMGRQPSGAMARFQLPRKESAV